MVAVIAKTNNAPFGWQLSTWRETAFHACGEGAKFAKIFLLRVLYVNLCVLRG
jgi:hypothetical protein